MKWDFFISHATEDKADVAKPVADMLTARGFKVWYDEYTLKVGDNLRQSIEQGLANSRYGVVILSKSFFAKKWTQLELDGLFALERPGEKRILPVWHNVTASDVERFSSILAMRLGVTTSKGPAYVVQKIVEAVEHESQVASVEEANPPSSQLHPHSIEILEAARNGNGTIMTIRHMGGFSVSAGGKSLGEDGDPREEALNLHCLDELSANGLIDHKSESLSVLTQEGFDYELPSGVVEAPKPQFPTINSNNFPYAKELLQAAVAGDGHLLFVRHMGGAGLRAGKWSHDSAGDRRTEARWESVLNELQSKGFLIALSGSVFLVSHLGFLWADTHTAQDASMTKPSET